MRKISADFIFPASGPPIKNGVITIDHLGTILALEGEEGRSQGDVEIHEGIIAPGFVNTHCHLELSYLRNLMPEGEGLDMFINDIELKRNNFDEAEIWNSALEAENEMLRNGIVAVGDISNSNSSFTVKARKRLKYHTFIELLGFHPDRAENAWLAGIHLADELKELGLAYSITPHAPYSASANLLKLINDYSELKRNILSIHLAESASEQEMFIKGTGKIYHRLKSFGIDTSGWKAPAKQPLEWMLPKISNAQKVQFVHNTFLAKAELDWLQLQNTNSISQTFFCFCPSANLYIENKLPDFLMFAKSEFRLCVGTDSLASNKQLSILEELKIIAVDTPEVGLDTLIKWSTLNGALFLGFEEEIGSIEKGKRPGLNQILNIDIENLKLKKDSRVVVLC